MRHRAEPKGVNLALESEPFFAWRLTDTTSSCSPTHHGQLPIEVYGVRSRLRKCACVCRRPNKGYRRPCLFDTILAPLPNTVTRHGYFALPIARARNHL